MNIFEVTKEGLRIARTSKSLWLYGFFVGLWTAAKGGNQGHAPSAPHALPVTPHAVPGAIVPLAIAAVAVMVLIGFMYFVSEGALIEGVTRVRRGRPPSVREGWHDGLAHCGVLFRITATYLAVTVGSLIILAAPVALALKFSGTALAVTLAIPLAVVAVAWVITLYMWRAFASRIAVLENRRALDAIAKARLFLHGRLLQGLKLIIAATLSRLAVLVVGLVALGIVAGIGVLALRILGMTAAATPVIALGAVILLPMAFILIAISGAAQSSIWTIGYLTQEGK